MNFAKDESPERKDEKKESFQPASAPPGTRAVDAGPRGEQRLRGASSGRASAAELLRLAQRVVVWSVDGWPMASGLTINSRAGPGRYPPACRRDRLAVPLYVGAHAPVRGFSAASGCGRRPRDFDEAIGWPCERGRPATRAISLRALQQIYPLCFGGAHGRYLVDSASSHMLVSKIKPCMSKYKQVYCETANGSLNQLSFI